MNNGDKLDRSEQLKSRTKQFALRVIRLFKSLPKSEEARIIGRQLLRAGTAIGANYRAACRARTRKEFVAKIRIVVEEADETAYWLELLIEAEVVRAPLLVPMLAETTQLLAIFAASRRTAEKKLTI